MQIETEGGVVKGSKRSPFMKWLAGWVDGGGRSGTWTVSQAWERAVEENKPQGCSWYAYGLLMGRHLRFDYYESRDY